MCWLNATSTGSFDTGAVHDVLDRLTRSGSGSENDPFRRWPGSETLSAASPAVLITLAEVEALLVLSAPGVKAPKLAGGPGAGDSVAGTVPPTLVCGADTTIVVGAPVGRLGVVT